jgi:hypothetical protein
VLDLIFGAQYEDETVDNPRTQVHGGEQIVPGQMGDPTAAPRELRRKKK